MSIRREYDNPTPLGQIIPIENVTSKKQILGREKW